MLVVATVAMEGAMAMVLTTLVAITIATGSRSLLCLAAVATTSMHAESMLAVAYSTMACNLGIYVIAMARGADAAVLMPLWYLLGPC